jgi:hypothetical protein
MIGVLRAAATSCRYQTRTGRIRIFLAAIGAFGAVASFSSVRATPLTVSATNGVFLQYFNLSPSILFGEGGEMIRYGAGSVVPNADSGTTGLATTTNLCNGGYYHPYHTV